MTSVPWKPWAFIRSTATGQSADSTRIATALSDAVMFSPSSLSSFCLMPRSKRGEQPAGGGAHGDPADRAEQHREQDADHAALHEALADAVVLGLVELDLALLRLPDRDRVAELDDLVVRELLERAQGVVRRVGPRVLDHQEAVLVCRPCPSSQGPPGWRVWVARARDRCVVRASLCLAGRPHRARARRASTAVVDDGRSPVDQLQDRCQQIRATAGTPDRGEAALPRSRCRESDRPTGAYRAGTNQKELHDQRHPSGSSR